MKIIKNTEEIEYKKMDMARAGRAPPKSSLHRLHGAFLLWIQYEMSNLYGNICGYIFLHCLRSHFVSISRKKSLHDVQTEFSATLTDMTEPFEV